MSNFFFLNPTSLPVIITSRRHSQFMVGVWNASSRQLTCHARDPCSERGRRASRRISVLPVPVRIMSAFPVLFDDGGWR